MAEEVQYELMDIDPIIEEVKAKEGKLSVVETALLSIAQSLQIMRDETRYIAWMMEQSMEVLEVDEEVAINRKMDS